MKSGDFGLQLEHCQVTEEREAKKEVDTLSLIKIKHSTRHHLSITGVDINLGVRVQVFGS